jgi:hypothetical protein
MLKEKFEDGDRYFVKTLVLVKDWSIMDVAEAIRQAIAAHALGDNYVLMILRRMCDPDYGQGVCDIRADLACYQAKQPPLSRYDEVVLHKREVKVA